MKCDLCIVILHYNDKKMTFDYIANLRELEWEGISHHFIVVDNASPDGSGKALMEQYKNDLDITVLVNRENFGFARGNNVGIRYAWEQMQPNMIAVSNNDIRIEDRKIPDKLVALYKSSEAAVIGPDIYSQKGYHQSPIRKEPFNKKELLQYVVHIDKRIRMLKIIRKIGMYEWIRGMKHLLGIKHKSGYGYEQKQENVVLQGAFFILTDRYMEQFSEGLYGKTFLYMEEDILAYRCIQKGLKMLYAPELKVIHYDGYASLHQSGNRCEKYLFELGETKKSCKIMLKLLEETESEE